MRPFALERAGSLPDAIAALARPGTLAIAGGTELLNWMKDGIALPDRLVDLNGLPGLDRIESECDGLVLGALVRLRDAAEHPAIRDGWPAVAQALLQSASHQIRNMASLGGNLLQRTRCPWFRTEGAVPCNKRRPGSGCAALAGEGRSAAILGGSAHCIATHPSDLAVALAALDASVEVAGPEGTRRIAVTALHRLPDDRPDIETVLAPGELITRIRVPASGAARRSHYLKLRERASFEFALVSAAAGIELDAGVIRTVRLALGGVAPKPWRLSRAEAALVGLSLADRAGLRRALAGEFAEARPQAGNHFKIDLAIRAAIRALENAGGAS